MRITTNRTSVIGLSFLAMACGIMISLIRLQTKTPSPLEKRDTSASPRVIDIKARKFEFLPNVITLKKGEPVILRLTSLDRPHGFLLKPFNIDMDIAPGKITEVAINPHMAGEYTIICDHYCGTGHPDMKMKLIVTEPRGKR